nr:MAG TPA: hypothetical protein [Bacteriophage sp.]
MTSYTVCMVTPGSIAPVLTNVAFTRRSFKPYCALIFNFYL